MLIKSEIPWHIVAIVFIAFASWVWNKFQEVAAERKRRRFQEVKRTYNQQERKQNQTSTPRAQAPAPPAKAKSPLQQMMDAVSGNVEEVRQQQELAEAQRKARLKQQQQSRALAAAQNRAEPPPPLPRRQDEPLRVPPPIQNKRTAATSESPALRTPVLPIKRGMVRRKKRRSGVRALLRGKDSIRQALIASEVLHKPKGLDDQAEDR
ncbi:hypothetical protein OAK81_02960 [Verrucomicrobiales bacterium]|nr:hypothetical protein [Verrucomicrobiales bacterium]